ncbi:Protein SPA1-RELATED like [Quillaja saponaria]|uniref:Protein SPA1-RELATED like n=1 Tax=Quillaja saponaria TaxID=32244 RepID=A0AAD7L5U2_QUISA|nr:Protein SPA1-RELATED like [Quillaja saponaria]
MDEGVVDGVAPLEMTEVAESAHHKNKENSLKPESVNILNSQEILIPGEVGYSQSSPQEFADILDGKSIDRSTSHPDASERPSCSPFEDDSVMVEELTVRGYNGSSLAIVGPSNNRERMQNKQNHWRHLYQLSTESAGGNLQSRTRSRDIVQATSSARENIGLMQNTINNDHISAAEHLKNVENKGGAGHNHGGIRTKNVWKSGFSEFFGKHMLKGKGVVCKGTSSYGLHLESRGQNHVKVSSCSPVDSDISPSFGSKSSVSSSHNIAVPRSGGSDHDGVNLREWLKARLHKESKADCLCMFRNIVDLVDNSHSQRVALHDLRPSYFKLLSSNQIVYLGSHVQKQMLDSPMNHAIIHSGNSFIRKRPTEQAMPPSLDLCVKKQKVNENVRLSGDWSQYPPRPGSNVDNPNDSKFQVIGSEEHNDYEEHIQISELEIHRMSRYPHASNTDQSEDNWYTSPEGGCTMSSNIYCLGVLLFELLGHFDSERVHLTAMSDLRNRILPPNFLSENPKEAGFCLWLLHPDCSSRPTTREILQSEVIGGLQEVCGEELSLTIDQDEAESELLLHFLISLREKKQKGTSKLVEDIRSLEADIEEVKRRNNSKKPLDGSAMQNDSWHGKEMMSHNKEPSSSEALSSISLLPDAKESRIMRNISQLESAYFSMRSKIQIPEAEATTHPDKDSLRNRENWHFPNKDEEQQKSTDSLGAFFNGLCKYARYNKFEVCGVLRNPDFNNPANVICSLSFDRDEDYFAAAGVSKKIKIFEFNALFNDSVDMHYPVVEMSNKSKLSCVCWNSYIKNYLASTDYDGVVKLWDASTGQAFSQFTEHEKRAWSVDFSQVYPTKFASGSDDGSVKLWSISDRNCLGTIRNIANVCCVQFSAESSHFLAFGSADYKTYCYDLRNVRTPWCVLFGHEKAVSYVKFLDAETLVTASTDNTLKIWDLNKTCHNGPSTNACSLTLTGHTNEKNFVGLSVADGYIACGSETNEVYAYCRSLPMPITSHKFGSIDPISGKETDDDNGQFVSSVCWRGKSDMVVAANSSGCIKVLQMV